MKRMALPVLAVMAGSFCGGEALSPDQIPDIEGTWSLIESVRNHESSCNYLGTMTLTQDLQTFVGVFSRTAQCSYGVQSNSTSSQAGNISRGRVGLETIEFRVGDCDYRGLLTSRQPDDRATGSILCATVALDGSLVSFSGNWHADRITD